MPEAAGGYVTFRESVDGPKVRARGQGFFDHYSQARMFFRSQSPPEQQHLIKAFRFELGKVTTVAVRERMVGHLAQIDAGLATMVAKGLGLELAGPLAAPPNLSVPADGKPDEFAHRQLTDRDTISPALSMRQHVPGPIASRKVAILVAEQFDATGVKTLLGALDRAGAAGLLVGPHIGDIPADDGKAYEAKHSILTTSSVLFDAVYVAGGERASAWPTEADAVDFVRDAFKHCKAIAATGEAIGLFEAAHIPTDPPEGSDPADDATVIEPKMTQATAKRFIAAMGQHRLWTREPELHLHL